MQADLILLSCLSASIVAEKTGYTWRYFYKEFSVTSSTANSWKSASLQTTKHTVTRSISHIQPLKQKSLCVFSLAPESIVRNAPLPSPGMMLNKTNIFSLCLKLEREACKYYVFLCEFYQIFVNSQSDLARTF